MRSIVAIALIAAECTFPASAGEMPICSGPKRLTCVVDGDTFWLSGTKIRIAGIDAPELSKPQCKSERTLAEKATIRLQALLSNGDIRLSSDRRDEDKFGRKLRFVSAGNQSVGETLVAEGLARAWDGSRHSWCD